MLTRSIISHTRPHLLAIKCWKAAPGQIPISEPVNSRGESLPCLRTGRAGFEGLRLLLLMRSRNFGPLASSLVQHIDFVMIPSVGVAQLNLAEGAGLAAVARTRCRTSAP